MKPHVVKAAFTAALCCSMLWTPSLGYKFYQDRLPNGDNIEHPCKPYHVWQGVGHRNTDGGGSNNVFGIDFKNNNFVWDTCLCNIDSDEDGRTNGEELGDPDCEWVPGQAPDTITGITHPGICEPLDDPTCDVINDFDVCAAVEFECDAIHSPDVRTLDLRFPPTPVPPQETSFICFTFDLPTDIDAHVIAWEPIIDNWNVLHHIRVYSTTDEQEGMEEPQQCHMISISRQHEVTLFSLGMLGNCFGESYGARIGINGAKRFYFSMHWNNPEKRDEFIDGSGIRFHYTPVLRPNDISIIAVGQSHLKIPPGHAEHVEEGVCGTECTKDIGQSVFIVQSYFHMHYLGKSGTLKLMRDGGEVVTLIDIPDYDYDRPINHEHATPIEMRPGDELVTSCTFSSVMKKTYTYWTRATSGEMCIVFLTIFPAVNGMRRSCMAFGPDYKGCSYYPYPSYGDCNLATFLDSDELTWAMTFLDEHCALDECVDGCEDALEEVRQHPCLTEEVAPFVLHRLARQGPDKEEFSHRMYSCSPDSIRPDAPPEGSTNITCPARANCQVPGDVGCAAAGVVLGITTPIGVLAFYASIRTVHGF